VDVWSAGVVLASLLYQAKEEDVTDDDNHEAAWQTFVARTKQVLQNDPKAGPEYDLLLKMLEPDPEKRISLDDAINHTYIQNYVPQQQQQQQEASGN